jgi:hypothetical protein
MLITQAEAAAPNEQPFHSVRRRDAVRWTFISCWHMSEHESAAMWKLYSQSSDAICIQTTFAKLANELPDFIHAGIVNYRDFASDKMQIDWFNVFLRKRKSFEHERELRAIVRYAERLRTWHYPLGESNGDGALIPVNLGALIEGIFISPTSSDWFKAVVEGVASKYELTVPVMQSQLLAKALF